MNIVECREVRHPAVPQYCKAFFYGPCRVFVGREPLGPGGGLRWHLSISHPTRYPTWDEIKGARYKLMPKEITVAMMLPPPEQYVNVHENCFHLHEVEQPISGGVFE